MSKNSVFDITKIKLVDIAIINARIDNNAASTNLNNIDYGYIITYNFEFGANLELKRIRLIFSIEVETVTREEKKPIGITAKFDISFFFEIENFSELIGDDPELTYDGDLEVSLCNIAYSTSRGIIYTRCQGTVLKSWILPILPTSEILKMHHEKIVEISK